MRPRVQFYTILGEFVAELYADHAPITVRNFLSYIDDGLYNNCFFYRSCTTKNDSQGFGVEVIQGGLGPDFLDHPARAMIAHESTAESELRHVVGTLSMARWGVGTAASEFFIVTKESQKLDFGGELNPDGAGYAAFGKVVAGLDIVQRIHRLPTGTTPGPHYIRDQAIIPPVSVQIRREIG